MGCLTDSHQLGWALGFEEVGLGKTYIKKLCFKKSFKSLFLFLEVFNVLSFKCNFRWAHLVEKSVKSLVLKQDRNLLGYQDTQGSTGGPDTLVPMTFCLFFYLQPTTSPLVSVFSVLTCPSHSFISLNSALF